MTKYRQRAIYTIEPFKPGREDRVEDGHFIINGPFMDMIASPGDYIRTSEMGFREVLSQRDLEDYYEPVEQEQACHE